MGRGVDIREGRPACPFLYGRSVSDFCFLSLGLTLIVWALFVTELVWGWLPAKRGGWRGGGVAVGTYKKEKGESLRFGHC